jgi:hypothetical protein
MTPTVEEFLATYPPHVQEIALKARALVLDVMPDVLEIVDVPGKLIGYGTENSYRGTICVIIPYTNHVNLGFARGTSLADVAGLLEGTGKRARHVKLKSTEDVVRPALRSLLEAAMTEHQSHL